MIGCYLILAWLFLIWVYRRCRGAGICNRYDKSYEIIDKYSWQLAIITFAPIIIWAAYRGNFIDTFAYRYEFLGSAPDSMSGISDYVLSKEKDKGFYFLTALIKILFGNRDVVYFFIIALFQGLCLIAIFRKYSINYLVSIFLFIASTDYLSWMFNGIRQFCAAAIIFAALPLLIHKKYIKLIAVVLFASLFHQSALIFIPFIFISQGKAWNKKTILFIVCSILAIAYVGEFTNLLGGVLEDTQYSSMVTDYQWTGDDGVNLFRALVYMVPMIISLLGYKEIKLCENPLIHICVNMSIVTSAFYLLAMFTSGIFMGRIPIYFSLFNYILLPWEIENLFYQRSRKLVYMIMIGGYLLFYYYQVHVIWGVV